MSTDTLPNDDNGRTTKSTITKYAWIAFGALVLVLTVIGLGFSNHAFSAEPTASVSVNDKFDDLSGANWDIAVMKSDWRSEMLNGLNDIRRSAGLGPLRTNNRLNGAAQRHSMDMAHNGVRGHYGSDGTDPGQRIRGAGYPLGSWAENVAWGQRNVARALDWWKNSPGHYRNMISSAVTECGFGLEADSSGRNMWTMKLASPRKAMDGNIGEAYMIRDASATMEAYSMDESDMERRVCTDGSTPYCADGNEARWGRCADGSRPVCADGSRPTRPDGDREPRVCEDGSTPYCTDGSEPRRGRCADGSRPVCADGNRPLRPQGMVDDASLVDEWLRGSGEAYMMDASAMMEAYSMDESDMERRVCTDGSTPYCADGSEPRRGRCADGSRPVCADGSRPTRPDGDRPTRPDGDREPRVCEDGSTPYCADGSQPRRGRCADGSRPVCADGNRPLRPQWMAGDASLVDEWLRGSGD